MAEFTIRVELYGDATKAYYDALHLAMQKKHYYRVIQMGNQWYHLPSAEYTAESGDTTPTQHIRDEVQKIAEAIWADSATFVTRANGKPYSSGLRTATPSEVKGLLAAI